MSKTSIDWRAGGRWLDCRTSGPTMGTRYSARWHAPPGSDTKALVETLASAVSAVDRQMSNWLPASDLSRLNRAAPGAWTPVPPPLAKVLRRAMEIGRETGNAFNIGVGDLVDAWGFGPTGSQPAQAPPAAAGARPPVDTLLELDPMHGRARKHAPLALDLCGIAKGFGVDELGRALDAHGITSWLVGIDGEMRARGTKPDGSAWAIGLEAPRDDRREPMAAIELCDAAVATSGDYRHHAVVPMDPRSASPACGGLASVTVVVPSCMDADAYATALMVLGAEAGRALATRLGLSALLLARDGTAWRASGSGCFENAGARVPGQAAD
jgi:thiamine biosynthesis lipoprotein